MPAQPEDGGAGRALVLKNLRNVTHYFWLAKFSAGLRNN
jgi:hypothetical protein